MKELFGTTKDGVEVSKYTLTNSKGAKAVFTDYGAIIVSLIMPDKDGKMADVELGYSDLAGYEADTIGLGSPIGPHANRIANAEAPIDGVIYKLEKNDGENNLHTSIPHGLNKRVWSAKETDTSVEFTLKMDDMELGFPGNREFKITYTLTEANELRIDYFAKSDKNTIFNITNHSYFNLGGQDSGSALDHEVKINAKNYTFIREGAIPTGDILPVAGTELDFTVAKSVGKDILSDNAQMKLVNGFDFNYVIDDYDGTLKECAVVMDPKSGRTMKVLTTLPGVHFYTGNWIKDLKGKGGFVYQSRYGICFETQFYPDSIHHDNFPDVVFGPGKDYASTTVFRFE